MLYGEIIAVYSQIHTKHINTLCGQNVELLNVKAGGTYSDHWALKSQNRTAIKTVTRFVSLSACYRHWPSLEAILSRSHQLNIFCYCKFNHIEWVFLLVWSRILRTPVTFFNDHYSMQMLGRCL
jgi:hypothetical protein